MIKFQALMHAVHQSIHSAAQAVEQAGIKHLDKFFDKIVDEDSQAKEELSQQLSEAINQGDKAKANELLHQIGELPEDPDLANEGGATYRPKMVAMAFPSQGKDGVDSTIVNVPLITLCPISSPRIQDVKFTADLEVTTDNNDELIVAFKAPQVSGEHIVTKDTTNTHIEISLVGHEPPEGLQKIVEGYEKALRAQIPG
ncbi:DUF2589 domain-containing protein [Thalassotalea sp. LPB0316]|uniref:DUF2589 domain-containing protein n=1 Tax=Thalassotalea sp. LPB0316 TaxID=2769490 RepID=UPI001866D4A1|nr:DUF2589 domain-containing protein [Thalassotalea sp. LPB0316]QOL25217.1 DUF2589 domain-containing protein [Thalassotalea sp. LPB0316]